ncbi:methyltransferase domain-containing protein [Rheinheimera maricola]|uniref:Methyltransferase domain-containing protein n=1 Tax=Rheinheimera maricola TaxID=2793282 RepID=A0ABS7X5N7_9GAMM|nr:methyltransferase domain-containing protein [Rheinheimera maricola]MBZ9610137.1 methyltransferase domain-containing protein [Rheinheimera maricola]
MRLIISTLMLALCHLPLAACELALDAANRSLADKKRDTVSLPCSMAKLLPLQPGNVVLDLLGGNGYFSELLSQQVGSSGKVYLHNNKAYLPYVDKQLQQRLAQGRLPNVMRLEAELEDLGISPNSLDAVYFIMGYHDMYHVAEGWKINPQQLMAQIYAALTPGGRMLVVDHNASAGSGIDASQELHRIEANYVQQELQQFGFNLIMVSDVLQNPDDDYSKSVFDESIRGKTDRFVLLLQKPIN